jgi:hypothetical protein
LPDGGSEEGASTAPTLPPGWRPMTVAQFADFLAAAIQANLGPEEIAGRRAVASADINRDFVFAGLQEARPKPRLSDFLGFLDQPLPTTSQELDERTKFLANGGDPRL